MNTHTQIQFAYSEVAQKAIEVGRKNHMRFAVVGNGPAPKRPFYRGAWWVEPVTEVPAKAQGRVALLKSAGITFKGFLVAHEIQLVEAKEERNEDGKESRIASSIPATTLAAAGSVLAAGVAMGIGLMLSAALSAVLTDPVIIGLLEDDVWLSIVTYYE